jgi:outer membrane immunogenic protein
LLASTALLAVAGSAMAADMRPPAPAPVYTKAPMKAPIYSWTGFYIGGNAGYGWGDDPVTLSGDPGFLFALGVAGGVLPSSIASNPRGFVGGGQLGWNYQFGATVVGVEADIDWTGIKSSGTFVSVFNPVTGIPRTVTGSQSLDWLSTFRARVGYVPTDRWLFYVTGGGAAGSAKVSASFTTNDLGGVLGTGCIAGTCETSSSSSTLWGWSAGGGVEVAVAGNVSVRGEYLHYDLGNISVTAQDPRFAPGVNVTTGTAHVRGEIVRAGVNVKLY